MRELARQRGRPLLVYSGRRRERFQNADVDRILGRPVSVWSFGEWWVALYDPDGLLADATSVSRRP